MDNHTTPTRTATERYEREGELLRFLSDPSNREKIEQRFFAQVDKGGPIPSPELGPCWLWKAKPINYSGYGRLVVNGQQLRSHVVSYLLFCGSILLGHEIDHRCNNRSCVNPDHLEPVTPSENKRRAAERRKADGRKVSQPSQTEEASFTRGLSILVSAMNGETNKEAAKRAGVSEGAVERRRRRELFSDPVRKEEIKKTAPEAREARREREKAEKYHAERLAYHKAHPEIQAQRRQDYLATR